MTDLLFHNGDLVVNEFGDISICEDEFVDIVQTANNNITMRYGDHMYHEELGNKAYNNRTKLVQNGIDVILAECRSAILNGDNRVLDVKSINAIVQDGANCVIDYVLTLEDGSEVDGKTAINIFNTEGGE